MGETPMPHLHTILLFPPTPRSRRNDPCRVGFKPVFGLAHQEQSVTHNLHPVEFT